MSWLFGDTLERKVIDATELTFKNLDSGSPSRTGVNVNDESALRANTVWACSRVICEDIGKVPLKLMRESEDGRSSTVAKEHPLHRVLSRRPNEWQTSIEWRMTTMLHALLKKGGYNFINRHRTTGEILELVPLMPGNVTPKQDRNWNLTYDVADKDGHITTLRRDQVLAIHGLSWNGYSALEVVSQGREAIALALAAERTQALMHGQGTRSGGLISTEQNLDDVQIARIREQFATNYSGIDNAFKAVLLDAGLKFQPWTMTGVDAQHFEQRRFQVEEVCRLFRVFPAMVGYSDKASTYASAEAFFIAHAVHTLQPWFTMIEQAIARDLLTEAEQLQGLGPKFFMQGLMRGDAKSRSEFYKAAINDGWMTRNEVRRLEDMNPLPGLDEPVTPMTMQKEKPAPGKKKDDGDEE